MAGTGQEGVDISNMSGSSQAGPAVAKSMRSKKVRRLQISWTGVRGIR